MVNEEIDRAWANLVDALVKYMEHEPDTDYILYQLEMVMSGEYDEEEDEEEEL